ncbi:hypothetical protein [Neobacillus cucumis]|uniref:Uncharacterized protein n=1 Tax=Neobacillus cucumis TaxID=1740721 RepID=A0A2N5H8S1_9BACI|nr:hypothetical protein [Neobacillus cucumis]PLS01926.1 hypothetical protein CVD27_22685 [Neobacillus cucumis]
MGFMDSLKANLKNAKEKIDETAALDRSLSNKLTCEVVSGANHIFTKFFTMGKTADGYALINRKHKIKIITCIDYSETTIGKSAGKKVAGAVVGGVLTGGVGAVVGALAVGNNKKNTVKYDKLIAVDENGYTHEVILKPALMQRQIINNNYVN